MLIFLNALEVTEFGIEKQDLYVFFLFSFFLPTVVVLRYVVTTQLSLASNSHSAFWMLRLEVCNMITSPRYCNLEWR